MEAAEKRKRKNEPGKTKESEGKCKDEIRDGLNISFYHFLIYNAEEKKAKEKKGKRVKRCKWVELEKGEDFEMRFDGQ